MSMSQTLPEVGAHMQACSAIAPTSAQCMVCGVLGIAIGLAGVMIGLRGRHAQEVMAHISGVCRLLLFVAILVWTLVEGCLVASAQCDLGHGARPATLLDIPIVFGLRHRPSESAK